MSRHPGAIPALTVWEDVARLAPCGQICPSSLCHTTVASTQLTVDLLRHLGIFQDFAGILVWCTLWEQEICRGFSCLPFYISASWKALKGRDNRSGV